MLGVLIAIRGRSLLLGPLSEIYLCICVDKTYICVYVYVCTYTFTSVIPICTLTYLDHIFTYLSASCYVTSLLARWLLSFQRTGILKLFETMQSNLVLLQMWGELRPRAGER